MKLSTKIILGGIAALGVFVIWKRGTIKGVVKSVVWDAITAFRISNLHPLIREDAKNFIAAADKKLGKKLRITSGLRTYEEQNELYNQGRTKEGKKRGGVVTNARGGQSLHNFGLAFDVVEIKDGKALWRNPDWAKIGRLGKQYGFAWGGDWISFKDKPHFQRTYGKRVKQLHAMYVRGEKKGNYVTLV